MIPLLPTLRPARFIAPKATPGELPFPLASPRTRWYYFARNGVWESVDVLGLSAGDEVLIPGYTSGLEVEAFEARGIIPVFYNLTASLTPDWQDIKNKLSRQTKVFYLIHYFGFPQPLPQAVEFCTQYRLLLFEDNALGFLSKDTTGKPLGSTGEVGLFCPRKTLPLPHGGMLVVNRPDLPLPPTPQQQPSRYSTLGETSSLMIRDIMKREGFAASAARIFKKNALPRLKRSLRTFGLAHTESGGAKFEPDKALWGMSGLSRHLLPRFDYNQIIARRRKNFCLLASCLRNLFHVRI